MSDAQPCLCGAPLREDEHDTFGPVSVSYLTCTACPCLLRMTIENVEAVGGDGLQGFEVTIEELVPPRLPKGKAA